MPPQLRSPLSLQHLFFHLTNLKHFDISEGVYLFIAGRFGLFLTTSSLQATCRDVKLLFIALMLIECFTFPLFLFFFLSHVVSHPLPLSTLSLSLSPSISLGQPHLNGLARHSLRRYFTLMVLFFSLLSVFLSFPHLSSRYCTDGVRCWPG